MKSRPKIWPRWLVWLHETCDGDLDRDGMLRHFVQTHPGEWSEASAVTTLIRGIKVSTIVCKRCHVQYTIGNEFL